MCRKQTKDAFYERGNTFPLKRFLNDGIPQPKIGKIAVVVSKQRRFTIEVYHSFSDAPHLTPQGPQSRFGDEILEI